MSSTPRNKTRARRPPTRQKCVEKRVAVECSESLDGELSIDTLGGESRPP